MASNTILNYYGTDFQNTEDNPIKNATNVIKSGFVNFTSVVNKEDEDFIADSAKILKLTTISIKQFATSYYKNAAFLEPSDIEQIKNSLANYKNDHEKINDFKQEIVEDLTEFQNQIKTRHYQRISDLMKEKQLCERQIKLLEFDKNRLIMERLAKIAWPYDQKTKEYDNKIAQLQVKIQQYTQKIEDLQAKRPAANEKDIIIYQMHLKEKFAKK